MQVIIKNVSIENVAGKGGKGGYSKAEVIYTYNGQARTQKLVSFTNPQVFGVVKDAKPGDTLDVTVTKNDQGYNQWSNAAPAGQSSGAPAESGNSNAPVRAQTNSFQRDFETKEERTTKQRLIVRQSSVAGAIASLTPGAKAPLKFEDVAEFADKLVAYVYQAPGLTPEVGGSELLDSDDIPY